MKVFLGPEDQIWSKKACLGNVVGIDNIGTSWNGLGKKILIKQEHKSTQYSKLGWIGCKSQQNKTNKF